jgi:hypothetical protein
LSEAVPRQNASSGEHSTRGAGIDSESETNIYIHFR